MACAYYIYTFFFGSSSATAVVEIFPSFHHPTQYKFIISQIKNLIAFRREKKLDTKRKHLCFSYFMLQAYGRDLMEAQDWCRKYMRSGNVKDLTQAWDLYYHVFRRISKQLPQVIENMKPTVSYTTFFVNNI